MALHNVFSDHGYPADEATVLALRSDVARAIRKATDGFKQKDAAKRLKIAQGDLSKIRNGHIDALSLERLIRLCVRLKLDCAAQWGASPHAALAVRGSVAELAEAASDSSLSDVSIAGNSIDNEFGITVWEPAASAAAP